MGQWHKTTSSKDRFPTNVIIAARGDHNLDIMIKFVMVITITVTESW